MANDIPRPRGHLMTAAALYPGAWRAYDNYRARRGVDLPNWPDWCFAPMAAAYDIVSEGGKNPMPLHMIADVARLAAVAAWRVTQGIYRYDKSLYDALIDTPIAGDLPAEVLYRMPEWCVYIETPGLEWLDAPLYGFWAHLESDVNTQRPELRLLLDGEAELTPFPIHIGKWPLSEAVSRAIDVGRLNASSMLGVKVPHEAQSIIQNAVPSSLTPTFAPLVSLLLYLCADEADLGVGVNRPSRPTPTRTRRGMRIFPPDNPTTWDVGVRIGAAMRAAYKATDTDQTDVNFETGKARPRAHIRRAHWHAFHAGVGRSERRLKWLPPIPVNVNNVDALPATVRPVF